MRMEKFDRNVSGLRDVVKSTVMAVILWHRTVVETTIISGISDSASDDTFEESVIALLADIDIRVKHQGIEAFRRFGKADRQMCYL